MVLSDFCLAVIILFCVGENDTGAGGVVVGGNGLSSGAIAGIAVGTVIGVAIVIVIIVIIVCKKPKRKPNISGRPPAGGGTGSRTEF